MAINADVSEASMGRRVIHYYRSPRIVVTSDDIENVDGYYLVRDLQLINRIHVNAHPARKLALILGAIELLVALPLAVAYGPVALLGAMLVAAAGLGVATQIDGRRNPRWMALHALYRNRDVTLFHSRNQQEFEQVRRAVIRAVEANRPVQ